MNLVKTQLNTYLKNSNVTEFNYGDGEFYVVKELTKNLVTVYHTNDTLMGNLNNVGIYDRRKEGFVLINCGYMFNQMVKPYKTGEPIPDRYNLLNELKDYIKIELESFYTSNKFKRGVENNLGNSKYLDLVEKEATKHIKNGTIPKVKEVGQKEIKEIEMTNELLLKILEDIYDVAYDMAEKILDKDTKGVYEHFLVQDIMDKMEELRNDKTNPLSVTSKLNELMKSSKYASYNVEVSWYKGQENAKVKVKKDYLKQVPLFMINKISWRSTVLFDSKDYSLEDYTQMTSKDWVNLLYNKRNYDYVYGFGSDLCIFNFIPKNILADKDFWLNEDVALGMELANIDKTLLADRDFMLKLSDTKKGILNIIPHLETSMAEDIDVCVNLIKNVSYSFTSTVSKNVLKNKDFQLKYLTNVENTMDIKYMEDYFDYKDSDIVDAIEKAILNISSTNQNNIPQWNVQEFNEFLINALNDRKVVEKLIDYRIIYRSGIAYLKASILNNTDFLDFVIANQNNLQQRFGGDGKTFERIYTKLEDQIKDSDHYLGNIMKIFVTGSTELSKITTLIPNFNKRTKLHLVLLTHSRTIFNNIIPTTSIGEFIENSNNIGLTIDRMIIREYASRKNKDIDLLVNTIKNNVFEFIYDLDYNDLDLFKALFDANPDAIDQIGVHTFTQNDALTNLASNYKSMIPKLANYKFRSYNQKFLIDDPDFVIKSLKHNFDDVLLINKPSKYDNNYSILNEPSFISRLIKEFPDKMGRLIPYLIDKKFEVIKDMDVIKEFLLLDFELIYYFKRTVYNNKELILDVMDNSTQSKDYIMTRLKNVGSKLPKEKEFK